MKITVQARNPQEAHDLILKGYTAVNYGTFVRETAVPEDVLDSLSWSPFKTREGEWTFINERAGGNRKSVLAEGEAKNFVDGLIAGNKAITERYVYSASKDGTFLHRVVKK